MSAGSFFLCFMLLLHSAWSDQNGTVYKIGAVLPLSGFLQNSGKIYLDAYTMVIQLFNNMTSNATSSPFSSFQNYNGTIPTIEFTVLDDQSMVDVSVKQIGYLSNVDAILGGVTSEIVAAQVQAVNNLSIPYVNGGGAASTIYSADVPWAFGVMSSIQLLASTEMVMLKDLVFRGLLPKPCKIVLVYEDSQHGADFQAGVRSFLNKTENSGYFTLSTSASFPYNQPFWNQTVDFILQSYVDYSPDILLIDAHYSDFVNIQSEVTRRGGLKYKLVSYGPTGGETEAATALGQGVNGLVFGTWWSEHYTNPQSQLLKSLWADFHQDSLDFHPLDFRAACAYEAARALLNAVVNSGTMTKTDVRQALTTLYLPDSLFLTEQLSFNPLGQATYDLSFEQVSYLINNYSTDVIYPVSIKQADPTIFDPVTVVNETTPVIVITKDNLGLELGVGLGGSAGLILMALAMYVYFFRKRRVDIPDLEKGGHPMRPSTPSPALSRRKHKMPLGSRLVTREEFPLLSTDWSLDMGLEGNQCPVDKPVTQIITLTNTSSSSVRFHIYLPEKTHKAEIMFTPAIGKIKKGRTVEVEVKVQFLCTAKWVAQCLVTATIKDGFKVHCPIDIKLESMLSTKLSYDEIKTTDVAIGEGSYGSVYQGEWRGMAVAVKKLKVQEANSYPEAVLSELQREVDIMTTLRHPNIINFVGASLTPGHLFIVTEFMPLGSLGKYLSPKCNLRTLLKVKIALDCARGMAFLHKCNILHRDLKPDNLLVVSMSRHAPVNVKLTDFGTARAVTLTITKATKMTVGLGTPIYMAPEVLGRGTYDEKSDVFSFAVLLYEMSTQSEPYKEFKSSWSVVKFVTEGNRLEIPSSVPSFFAELITKCWSHNPADRPKFSTVVEELEQVLVSRGGMADSQTLTEELSSESKKKAKQAENAEIAETPSKQHILSGLSSIFNSPNVSVSNIVNPASPAEGAVLGPRHGPRLQKKKRQDSDEKAEERNGTATSSTISNVVSFSAGANSAFSTGTTNFSAGTTNFGATSSPYGYGVPDKSTYNVLRDALRRLSIVERGEGPSPVANAEPSPRKSESPRKPESPRKLESPRKPPEHAHDDESQQGEEHDGYALCHVCRSRTNSRSSQGSSKNSSSESAPAPPPAQEVSPVSPASLEVSIPVENTNDDVYAPPRHKTDDVYASPPDKADGVHAPPHDKTDDVYAPAHGKDDDVYYSPGEKDDDEYFSRELRYQQHSDGAINRSQYARSLVGTEFPNLETVPEEPPKPVLTDEAGVAL